MIAKILPLVLILVGTGAGLGAGMFLRPEPELSPEPETAEAEETVEGVEKEPAEADGPAPDLEYVKLSNQFVVPIVKDQEVVSLVVLALSLEVPLGNKEAVFRREPKLRDSFLQVLFDHANIGGFDGAFTDARNMAALRSALREVGQKDMGVDIIRDVLILEIARQDY